MDIVLVSDTHGQHGNFDIPDGDILIHCGDVTQHGRVEKFVQFSNWIRNFNHDLKLFVPGNHDFCCEEEMHLCRDILDDVFMLIDESIEYKGVKFYGSPWQPEFGDWAFNVERGEKLENIWSNIPEDTDILLTHSPPYGILDFANRGKHVGCKNLRDRLLEVSPDYHLFGHIHEASGRESNNGIDFINASCQVYSIGYSKQD